MRVERRNQPKMLYYSGANVKLMGTWSCLISNGILRYCIHLYTYLCFSIIAISTFLNRSFIFWTAYHLCARFVHGAGILETLWEIILRNPGLENLWKITISVCWPGNVLELMVGHWQFPENQARCLRCCFLCVFIANLSGIHLYKDWLPVLGQLNFLRISHDQQNGLFYSCDH